MSAQHPMDSRPAESTLARFANGFVLWIGRHWLLLINSAVALYVLLPFLAPVLMQLGLSGPARALYGVYSFACHQLPDHSYFLFGEDPVYSLQALEARGLAEGLSLFEQRAFIGNESTGFKVAYCQRDVAIYGSVLLSGLLFGLVRRRISAPPLRVYALFLIPIALDGVTQLIGLRESTWLLRTVTGALFGMASVWLAYPYLEEAMNDVVKSELKRRSRVVVANSTGSNTA